MTEADWKSQKIDRNGLKVDKDLQERQWNRRKLASAISHRRWGQKRPNFRPPHRNSQQFLSRSTKIRQDKLFGPVALGTTSGLSQGHTRFVLGTKPSLCLEQTQVFSLLYTAEAQFVPGTNPVRPWANSGSHGGRKSVYIYIYGIRPICRLPNIFKISPVL